MGLDLSAPVDPLAGEAWALLALRQVRLGDVEAAVASGQRALVRLAAGGLPAAVSRVHGTSSLVDDRVGLHSLAVSHAATALVGPQPRRPGVGAGPAPGPGHGW